MLKFDEHRNTVNLFSVDGSFGKLMTTTRSAFATRPLFREMRRRRPLPPRLGPPRDGRTYPTRLPHFSAGSHRGHRGSIPASVRC